MIILSDVYMLEYAVGGSVKEPVFIAATTANQAHNQLLQWVSEKEDYAGEEIRVLSTDHLQTVGTEVAEA